MFRGTTWQQNDQQWCRLRQLVCCKARKSSTNQAEIEQLKAGLAADRSNKDSRAQIAQVKKAVMSFERLPPGQDRHSNQTPTWLMQTITAQGLALRRISVQPQRLTSKGPRH